MSNVVTIPGRLAAQYIRTDALSRGDKLTGQSFAEARGWPVVAGVFKSLVAPLSIADVTTALSPVAVDLVEFLRPRTIIGRLQGIGRAPLRTRITLQTVGGRAQFVAPGGSLPVRAGAFTATDALMPFRVGGISVVTRELVESNAPGSDALLANDTLGSLGTAIDLAFADPAIGPSASSPGSITHDAVRYQSSGSTLSAVDADLARLVAVLVAADCSLLTASWIMNPGTATSLSLLRGSSGAPAFPQINSRGGSLLGMPVITSTSAASSGSPGEKWICLAEASEVLIGDSGEANIEYSDRAALNMDSSPTNSASNATALTSLWQQNMVGIKAERILGWAVRRPGAVAVLESVTY